MTPFNRVLYFDCFAGASGDMILGSLLDLGLDVEALRSELAKLSLTGYSIEAKKVMKNGFTATKFDVLTGACHEGHAHHHIIHDHTHNVHDYHCEHNRNLEDIIKMIEESHLASQVREKSIAIFRRLAEAEARIHGTVPEKVHFHEVGAVDAIVDIVGAVIGIHLLEADRIVVSPLPMGKGFVTCQHGTIPVPAPATMELLAGMQTYGSDHGGETVTPTGAAILSTLAGSCGAMPAMTVGRVGYGAGTRDFGVPNLLRAIMGNEAVTGKPDAAQVLPGEAFFLQCDEDMVTELEANIDDMNPELYDYIFERLFAQGALDVFLVPVQMKKNRPANVIRVLCREKDLRELAVILFSETSTIGIRVSSWKRYCLKREVVLVTTEYGDIRVKKAFLNGNAVNYAPEYDDCREKAKLFKIPLKRVYQAALKAFEATGRDG